MIWEVIKKALSDTWAFFGWNKQTSISFSITFMLGLVVFWYWKGLEAVKDQIVQFIAFGLVGVGIWAILIFVIKLIQAPIHIKYAREWKPKLRVLSAVWSSNRGLSGGTWWLKIENEGIGYADSIGILENIELAYPGKDQSMDAHSQSCSLIWSGSNPVPGKCQSMLDVIYREPDTFSSYHYGLACSNYNKKNISLPTGMDILLIISIIAEDTKPLHTVCYFLGRDSVTLDKFEILDSNLYIKPTIEDCREMLMKHKANSQNV